MNDFQLFARPWWVNILLLIPIISYFFWRRKGLNLSKYILLFAAVFAVAFGLAEAAVAAYLRAAIGLLPGYGGTVADVSRLSSTIYQQIHSQLPQSLLTIEFCREAATMLMIIGVAFLASKHWRERWALFLWVFAIWDIFYYLSFWILVRWPSSLLNPDVLFLIPVPWFSQVWFPSMISFLAIAAVILTRNKSGNIQ